MQHKVNQRFANTVKPPESGYALYWDEGVSGFGLRVTSSGFKSYVLQYRVNGRERRFTIGRHGSPWDYDTARSEAKRLLGQVEGGLDPVQEKMALSKEMTLSELCDLYWREGTAHKRESTLISDKGRIERHIKPLLGRMQVTQVATADVQRFMQAVAAGQTKQDATTGKKRGRSIVRGGKGVANRSLILLSAIFNFAILRGMRPDNPCRGVKKYAGQVKERFLSDKELKELGTALNELEAAGKNRTAISAIRLLAFTGARRNEILSLQWDFIDEQNGCLRLPESKENRGRVKVIPLGAPALELLAGMPRLEGNPYVFPGEGGKGQFKGLSKFWNKQVRVKAKLPGVRVHDLRHSFASVGAAGGGSLVVIGTILGHRSTATTKRYSHLADNPVKAAANKISGRIAASMAGKAGGKVIKMRQGRK